MRKDGSFISRVISDGRVTIPKHIRKAKKIMDGTYVRVKIIEKV